MRLTWSRGIAGRAARGQPERRAMVERGAEQDRWQDEDQPRRELQRRHPAAGGKVITLSPRALSALVWRRRLRHLELRQRWAQRVEAWGMREFIFLNEAPDRRRFRPSDAIILFV
jgi:hypothetical protein